MPGDSSVRPPDRPRWGGFERRPIAQIVLVAIVLAALGTGCAHTAQAPSPVTATVQEATAPLDTAAYPGFREVDSTRFGPIFQHTSYQALRIDVRYFQVGTKAPWPDQLSEPISSTWATNDTFFRHDTGLAPDPRNGKNYDVAGFVKAYSPLRPGPNAVVSGVWLRGTSKAGLETYVVLVARRNPGEYMWPDHKATFTRDSKTGIWKGRAFEPVVIENWRS
jgi:hypothetical protein